MRPVGDIKQWRAEITGRFKLTGLIILFLRPGKRGIFYFFIFFFPDGEFINCYRQVIIPECGGTKLAVTMHC